MAQQQLEAELKCFSESLRGIQLVILRNDNNYQYLQQLTFH
ncbi:hypothetical protein X564_10740 [Pseudoalteromonas agarivorans]|nr:hypothetical protein X564_10740 [Pseudoalteromonas agarivorans]